MTGTLAHEGIHYLRTAGAFSNQDGSPSAAWKTLEEQAGKWRKDYGIDARYEGDVGGKDDAQRRGCSLGECRLFRVRPIADFQISVTELGPFEEF